MGQAVFVSVCCLGAIKKNIVIQHSCCCSLLVHVVCAIIHFRPENYTPPHKLVAAGWELRGVSKPHACEAKHSSICNRPIIGKVEAFAFVWHMLRQSDMRHIIPTLHIHPRTNYCIGNCLFIVVKKQHGIMSMEM